MAHMKIKEANEMVFTGNIRYATKGSKGLVTTIPRDVVKELGLTDNYDIKYTLQRVADGVDYEIEFVPVESVDK